MVKRLADEGLLEHVPYRGVRLTESGRMEALRVVRRHRILETYLVERLGYAWVDVHAEAERLEHAASDRLVERMAAALENPSHDPHGAPIPTRSGEIENVDFATLADAAEGDRVQIRAVADEDADRLRYLEARGLTPGAILSVEEREPFEGPLTVRVDSPSATRQVLGFEMARRIFVTGTEA
jgi:DtxR family Mn-dependent transcriptional regulator